jgi:predicted phage-related endonuclease
MEGAVFDFSRAREISRKITIEDDPVKIDKFLSNLHEIVSKEFEKRQKKHSRRTNAASRLNSPTPEKHS